MFITSTSKTATAAAGQPSLGRLNGDLGVVLGVLNYIELYL